MRSKFFQTFRHFQPIRINSQNRIYSQNLKYFQNKNTQNDQSRKLKLYTIVGVALLGSYYIYNLEKVPLTGRIRFNNISKAQEIQMSRLSEQEILSEYRSSILPQSHPITIQVAKIAKRILAVTNNTMHNWRIVVINSNQINAFVLPTGTIFVFTGILPVMKDNDGIATVLGHEIAHVLSHHAAEKISWMNLLSIARFGLILIGLDPGPALSSLILQYGFLLPNSRVCEVEADKVGLELMAKACFNPKKAIQLWERMSILESGKDITSSDGTIISGKIL
jgi:metalloendopeptidase OMA1, mitochondrial